MNPDRGSDYKEIPRPPFGVLGMTWFFVVTGKGRIDRASPALFSPSPVHKENPVIPERQESPAE